MAQLLSWDVIVITCKDELSAGAYEKELKVRQDKGVIDPSTKVLAVADPDAKVGSGGATLNALLVAAELLSSEAGYTAVSPDVFKETESHSACKILILHMGRDFPFDGCCRCFTSVPGLWNVKPHTHLAVSSVMTHLDYLLYMLSRICHKTPPGVWVASSDMFLFDIGTEPREEMIDWEKFSGGIMAIAIPGSKEYAQRHGVYRIDEQNEVHDIVFRGTPEEIEPCSLPSGLVPIVSGIVFMCPAIASKLLDLQSLPPLENCTYVGIDSGNSPLFISLYFDMLLSLAKGVSQAEYEDATRPGLYARRSAYTAGPARPDSGSGDRRKARALVWKLLRKENVRMQVTVLDNLEHDYVDLYPKAYIKRVQRLARHADVSAGTNAFSFSNCVQSYIEEGGSLSDQSVMVNCLCLAETKVADNCVLINCSAEVPLTVSQGCLVNSGSFTRSSCSGLPQPVVLPENSVLIDFQQNTERGRIVVFFSVNDDLELPMEEGTYCGLPWAKLFERTGIESQDLWDDSVEKKTLLNAKLFSSCRLVEAMWLSGASQEGMAGHVDVWRKSTRFSIADVLDLSNVAAELERRTRLAADVVVSLHRRALHTRQPIGWAASFRATTRNGHANQLFSMLDSVAIDSPDPGVKARALAGIAEVLAAVAGDGNGLRSGPGANRGWKAAYKKLHEGNVKEGVELLTIEREKWMNIGRAQSQYGASQSSPMLRPRELLRAARHYEGAAQILISQAVKTAKKFAEIKHENPPVAMGKWVQVESPSRGDLAGGWSDTPPITYENGGSVTNIAIKVKGKRPIGAKVKRIPELKLRLCLSDEVIECSELKDLEDYCIPTAKGALLKTAFYAMGVVDLLSSVPLAQQLKDKYDGGFELHTWSDLPSGSGLGTSSILAGVVITAILKVVGHAVDRDTETHMVLIVEQMLTTGGGWQDQAGGLFGGVKITRSPSQLPLKVNVETLDLKEETLSEFDRRFVLIYTGRTRLARNILQEVIRSWYGQLPSIVNTAKALVSGSEECAQAFRDGDLEKVGFCMSRYWEQKKVMAYGCEPEAVRRVMTQLKPHVYGQTMAGAGGGGFMFVLMREPDTGVDIVKDVLHKNNLTSFEVYEGSVIDRDGLWIHVEE